MKQSKNSLKLLKNRLLKLMMMFQPIDSRTLQPLKSYAIFDAFEILNRIEIEKALLEGKNIEKRAESFKGFAERRSK